MKTTSYENIKTALLSLGYRNYEICPDGTYYRIYDNDEEEMVLLKKQKQRISKEIKRIQKKEKRMIQIEPPSKILKRKNYLN